MLSTLAGWEGNLVSATRASAVDCDSMYPVVAIADDTGASPEQLPNMPGAFDLASMRAGSVEALREGLICAAERLERHCASDVAQRGQALSIEEEQGSERAHELSSIDD